MRQYLQKDPLVLEESATDLFMIDDELMQTSTRLAPAMPLGLAQNM